MEAWWICWTEVLVNKHCDCCWQNTIPGKSGSRMRSGHWSSKCSLGTWFSWVHFVIKSPAKQVNFLCPRAKKKIENISTIIHRKKRQQMSVFVYLKSIRMASNNLFVLLSTCAAKPENYPKVTGGEGPRLFKTQFI